MIDEHWLDRAIEDKLGEIIDRYRSQGKDVHNVGRLREKVSADINALRGTPHWAAMQNKYNPTPLNRLAWCARCDKPVTSGSVSAWLEDKTGRIYCSEECRDDPRNTPMNLVEYQQKAASQGSVRAHRKEVVDGRIVPGEELVFTLDEVNAFALKFANKPAVAASNQKIVEDDEVVWD